MDSQYLPLAVPFLVHLGVHQGLVHDPERQGPTATAFVGGVLVAAVGVVQGVLVEPGIGQEERRFPIAPVLDLPQELGRFNLCADAAVHPVWTKLLPGSTATNVHLSPRPSAQPASLAQRSSSGPVRFSFF